MTKRILRREEVITEFGSRMPISKVIQKLQELEAKYPGGYIDHDLNKLTFAYEREETDEEYLFRQREELFAKFFDLKEHLESMEKYGNDPDRILEQMREMVYSPILDEDIKQSLLENSSHLWAHLED